MQNIHGLHDSRKLLQALRMNCMHRLCIKIPSRKGRCRIFDEKRPVAVVSKASMVDPICNFQIAGHPDRSGHAVVRRNPSNVEALDLVFAQGLFQWRVDEAWVDHLWKDELVTCVGIRPCIIVKMAAWVVWVKGRLGIVRLVVEMNYQGPIIRLSKLAKALQDVCNVALDFRVWAGKLSQSSFPLSIRSSHGSEPQYSMSSNAFWTSIRSSAMYL